MNYLQLNILCALTSSVQHSIELVECDEGEGEEGDEEDEGIEEKIGRARVVEALKVRDASSCHGRPVILEAKWKSERT